MNFLLKCVGVVGLGVVAGGLVFVGAPALGFSLTVASVAGISVAALTTACSGIYMGYQEARLATRREFEARNEALQQQLNQAAGQLGNEVANTQQAAQEVAAGNDQLNTLLQRLALVENRLQERENVANVQENHIQQLQRDLARRGDDGQDANDHAGPAAPGQRPRRVVH